VKTVNIPDTAGENTMSDVDGPHQSTRSYRTSEFVSCGDDCPWCGSGGVIYCSCGRTLCKSVYSWRDGVQWFSSKGCGCDRPANPSTRMHITGRTEDPVYQVDGPKAKAPAQKIKKKQKRIGHGKKPLLSRR
jgi:hypothetical protein